MTKINLYIFELSFVAISISNIVCEFVVRRQTFDVVFIFNVKISFSPFFGSIFISDLFYVTHRNILQHHTFFLYFFPSVLLLLCLRRLLAVVFAHVVSFLVDFNVRTKSIVVEINDLKLLFVCFYAHIIPNWLAFIFLSHLLRFVHFPYVCFHFYDTSKMFANRQMENDDGEGERERKKKTENKNNISHEHLHITIFRFIHIFHNVFFVVRPSTLAAMCALPFYI